jgi:hypothetical protein
MRVLTGETLMALTLLLGLGGCASIGPPEAPSLELPKAPTDLRASRKGNDVTLTWTVPTRTTERQSVRYRGKTLVCRSLLGKIKECTTAVGEVAAPANFEDTKVTGKKWTASFIDKLNSVEEENHSQDFATYAVEVMNSAGRGAGISNQVQVSLLPTLPPFTGFAATTRDQGVAISWKCEPEQRKTAQTKYLFRIYRRLDGSGNAAKIADVEATACAERSVSDQVFPDQTFVDQSFLDQTIEWEKTYFYRGTVVSVIAEPGHPAVEVEGDDMPEVKVFAHDVFPPAVPEGLQAVFSGPGQKAFIDLIWSPVGDADLAGYNIYRREEGGAVAKVNTELVKTPAYRDEDVRAGKNYLYSVAAVDERGNESGRSAEAKEFVPTE